MKHIAAIITEYWPRSHADVIVGKFLRGFPCDEGLLPPRVKIVSMYLDHVVAEDTGVETAARFGVPIYPSILQALTLGTDELAVDGVLIVGEHGQYPLNERGQKLYPRKHLFEQVAGVISTAEKPVPVFTDKHLSYNWTDAKWMYDRAKDLGIPLMAGSSLPVAWRRPQLQHPLGTKIGRAALVGYGGTESYGFHTLEALQCMVERRAGGESGVASVQCLSGGEVWSWLDAHPTDAELVKSAGLAIAETECAWDEIRDHVSEPHAFLLHYRDGLEATALMLNGYCRSWAYAADVEGDVQSCEVVLQTGGAHGHFS